MTENTILTILIVLLIILICQLIEARNHCRKNYLFGFNHRKRIRRKIDRLTGGRRATDATLILPKLDTSKYYVPKKKIYKLNHDGTIRLR